MTIVYLKHQTLFQDLFVKSQCFVRPKFWPGCFGDAKTRKLIFITKKAMTIKFQSILHEATEFHLIWPTFLWIMLCQKFPMLKTGRIFVPYQTISNMEPENWKLCSVQFQVKFVRNTHVAQFLEGPTLPPPPTHPLIRRTGGGGLVFQLGHHMMIICDMQV